MKATKSKMSKNFAMKESLRYMHHTDPYNQTGAPASMAGGGMVDQTAAAIRRHQQDLDNAGATLPPKAPAPMEPKPTMPIDPLTAQLQAKERQKAVAEKQQPPKPWYKFADGGETSAQADRMFKRLGMKDGGAVLPKSLRCMEDGGYVSNDEEEGLDRARLQPGQGWNSPPAHLPPMGKGFADGGVADYGRGGKVRGPGGPTDDKIPAMLSNGEYVLPADTVAHVGKGNLDALRAATHQPVSLRHMADGGPFSIGAIQEPLSTYTNYKQPMQYQGPRPTNSIATANLNPQEGGYHSGFHPNDTAVGSWNSYVDKQKTSPGGYPVFAEGGEVEPVRGPLNTLAIYQSRLDHGTSAIPSTSVGVSVEGPKGQKAQWGMGGARSNISMADGGWVGVGGARLRYANGGFAEGARLHYDTGGFVPGGGSVSYRPGLIDFASRNKNSLTGLEGAATGTSGSWEDTGPEGSWSNSTSTPSGNKPNTVPGSDATEPGNTVNTLRAAMPQPGRHGVLPEGISYDEGTNTYSGSGEATRPPMTTEEANDYYGNKLRELDARVAPGPTVLSTGSRGAGAPRDINDILADPHLTRSAKNRYLTARGQDIMLQSQMYGHGIQARGQDILANTAAAERGVQMRGQDLTHQMGMIGQQRMLAQEMFTRKLETQKYGLDVARTLADQRRQEQDRFDAALKEWTGLNDKSTDDQRALHNEIRTKVYTGLANQGIGPGDVPRGALPQLFQMASEATTQDISQHPGFINWVQRNILGKEQHPYSMDYRDYFANGPVQEGGIGGPDVPTPLGPVDAARYNRGDRSGTVTLPWNKAQPRLERLREMGPQMEALDRKRRGQ